MIRRQPRSTLTEPLFPYKPRFRSWAPLQKFPGEDRPRTSHHVLNMRRIIGNQFGTQFVGSGIVPERFVIASAVTQGPSKGEMEQKPVEIICRHRSEEHKSELQSLMRT